MPLISLHRRIASIALHAAARYGFALGGGNALIAHGIISRPTQDVDLVTNRETGVKAAAGPVEAALRREGFTAQRNERTSELADVFPGLGDELTDWRVTTRGGRRTDLQLAYFGRSWDPVLMDVGPVLHLEDVAGSKVSALAGRVKARDYVDTAALLGRWTPAELIGFARRLDPGLDGRDMADAAVRLDRMSDEEFSPFGLTREDVDRLRERFAAWPRDARIAVREIDSTAVLEGREKPSHTREKVNDLEAGIDPGQVRIAGTLGRRPRVGRERVRGEEPEIGR